MIAANRRYTLAELLALPEDDDETIYDLLGGELGARKTPDLNHGVVVSMVTGLRADAYCRGRGQFFLGVHAVALDYPVRGMAALDVSHPDLFFIRAGREALWRGKRLVEGVPDLIIEARSRSTTSEHTPGGQHFDAYARNGLPHYWIADPRERRIEQYMLQGVPYECGSFGRALILREGDTLTLPGVPELAMPVADVFRDVVYGEGE